MSPLANLLVHCDGPRESQDRLAHRIFLATGVTPITPKIVQNFNLVKHYQNLETHVNPEHQNTGGTVLSFKVEQHDLDNVSNNNAQIALHRQYLQILRNPEYVNLCTIV